MTVNTPGTPPQDATKRPRLPQSSRHLPSESASPRKVLLISGSNLKLQRDPHGKEVPGVGAGKLHEQTQGHLVCGGGGGGFLPPGML